MESGVVTESGLENERLAAADAARTANETKRPLGNRNGIEEIVNDDEDGVSPASNASYDDSKPGDFFQDPGVSVFKYFRAELTRNYQLQNDEARYSERREKVYTFMKMPRDVEKFMMYGWMQCLDAFLFLFTFLPLRLVLAVWYLLSRPCRNLFGHNGRTAILQPAEICDILKGITFIVSAFLVTYIDTSMMYHLIKSQSVIKLYIFFNMLEVGDRLLSAFGQDILDTLFWTATEPRERKRKHFGVIPHLLLAIFYVYLHAVLVLFQVTTLNVAINSNNKALLTIMMSNNFVELKGSVFKKFEKNNLFQMSCSDVRERFHYVILLLIVIIQTMKEYSWKEERFWILLPDCLMVLLSEILVDWVKHAFITRFNEIPTEVYKQYTISLGYDVVCSKHKNAFSDYSDLVSRRMGFIPLPLGVLLYRITSQAFRIPDMLGVGCIILGYFCLISLKMLNSIIILGMAYNLIEEHKLNKKVSSNKSKIPRCTSQPPSRKHSTEKIIPAQISRSVSHSRNPSLTDESNIMENQLPLGPAPLFCNSSVSLNSLGLPESLLDDRNTDGATRKVSIQSDIVQTKQKNEHLES